MRDIPRDLTRTTLAILSILLLIAVSFWVLRPFLAAAVWATMIVVATWPLFVALERHCGGRRAPAVALMTLGMLMLLVVPLWLAISTIVEHLEVITVAVRNLARSGLPQAPQWLVTLPLVGGKLAALWGDLADAGASGLLARVQPYAAQSGKWVLAEVGGLGYMLLQFVLVVLISAVLYAGGEGAAATALRFGRRLAGVRGEGSIVLAGQAIRGVALGVGVTAIVQSVLGGFGLAASGIPFASLLTAIMLMLCIAQLGPALILFPAVGWLFWSGDSTWGGVLLVWSLLVVSLDNFLRPLLIKRGADLPLLLIFSGVIGGMLAFGLIGIFVGPVALAVTYTLLDAWLAEAGEADEQAGDA